MIDIVSAGGIIIQSINSKINICIVEKDVDTHSKWYPRLRQLPKGGQQKGETLEETAIREVLEETGFHCKIDTFLDSACWEYSRKSIHYRETVFYYLMKMLPLQRDKMDGEFDRIVWVNIYDNALNLSYPEESDLIKRNLEVIKTYSAKL